MNERGKEVDKTYLSIDTAEERGFIHRDYIAHCLRWSHVCKRLAQGHAYKDARILDIGCGRELPLAKTLYSSRYIPQTYVGVDIGPIEQTAIDVFASGKFPLDVLPHTDVCKLGTPEQPYNWVTCFEVLEHVEPFHMLTILRTIRRLASDDAFILISTPCWNMRDCAANHVNEIRYEVLGSVFEREGFRIQEHYGTFASIRDYESFLQSAGLADVFERLRGYYDTNYLSTVFAPLFPQHSRNVLWVIRKNLDMSNYTKKFPDLSQIDGQWSSSSRWEELR